MFLRLRAHIGKNSLISLITSFHAQQAFQGKLNMLDAQEISTLKAGSLCKHGLSIHLDVLRISKVPLHSFEPCVGQRRSIASCFQAAAANIKVLLLEQSIDDGSCHDTLLKVIESWFA